MIKAVCPICHKEVERQSLADWSCYPFCSQRCKLIDLGRWLGEVYRIEAEQEDDAQESEEKGFP